MVSWPEERQASNPAAEVADQAVAGDGPARSADALATQEICGTPAPLADRLAARRPAMSSQLYCSLRAFCEVSDLKSCKN